MRSGRTVCSERPSRSFLILLTRSPPALGSLERVIGSAVSSAAKSTAEWVVNNAGGDLHGGRNGGDGGHLPAAPGVGGRGGCGCGGGGRAQADPAMPQPLPAQVELPEYQVAADEGPVMAAANWLDELSTCVADELARLGWHRERSVDVSLWVAELSGD